MRLLTVVDQSVVTNGIGKLTVGVIAQNGIGNIQFRNVLVHVLTHQDPQAIGTQVVSAVDLLLIVKTRLQIVLCSFTTTHRFGLNRHLTYCKYTITFCARLAVSAGYTTWGSVQ